MPSNSICDCHLKSIDEKMRVREKKIWKTVWFVFFSHIKRLVLSVQCICMSYESDLSEQKKSIESRIARHVFIRERQQWQKEFKRALGESTT